MSHNDDENTQHARKHEQHLQKMKRFDLNQWVSLGCGGKGRDGRERESAIRPWIIHDPVITISLHRDEGKIFTSKTLLEDGKIWKLFLDK